ncbi:uncharacterized protein DUF3307 [Murinocardiopsis flavida]|uniref:Uncharacterized protein DUF3307 n=1 Tax=Murinocardiopsis flavida TaxID=645275 RepID=A0A2P8CDL5_9ACTN|nr:DUF3307 domain-containing protein [Murinocardiopsis flavida]PSK83040.1 uncharacterized protein DUF3307 [Murinocardiopsis flavida]
MPENRPPTRPAVFAAVLAALKAAHDVGDFMAQTDRQSARKPCAADRAADAACTEGASWRALAAHVASYHAVQTAALITVDRALGLGLAPARMVAGIAFSAVTHAVIDRRWPVRLFMDTTGSTAFRLHGGGAMHVDQAAHHACLAAAALVMATGPDRR